MYLLAVMKEKIEDKNVSPVTLTLQGRGNLSNCLLLMLILLAVHLYSSQLS